MARIRAAYPCICRMLNSLVRTDRPSAAIPLCRIFDSALVRYLAELNALGCDSQPFLIDFIEHPSEIRPDSLCHRIEYLPFESSSNKVFNSITSTDCPVPTLSKCTGFNFNSWVVPQYLT